jgi:hypothetical protein
MEDSLEAPRQEGLRLIVIRHNFENQIRRNALKYRQFHFSFLIGITISQRLQSDISMDALVAAFKDVIDDDWGPIDPLEVDDSEDWPFIYVVLGGDVYSEAILITAWATEDGQPKIDGFELGRP